MNVGVTHGNVGVSNWTGRYQTAELIPQSCSEPPSLTLTINFVVV